MKNSNFFSFIFVYFFLHSSRAICTLPTRHSRSCKVFIFPIFVVSGFVPHQNILFACSFVCRFFFRFLARFCFVLCVFLHNFFFVRLVCRSPCSSKINRQKCKPNAHNAEIHFQKVLFMSIFSLSLVLVVFICLFYALADCKSVVASIRRTWKGAVWTKKKKKTWGKTWAEFSVIVRPHWIWHTFRLSCVLVVGVALLFCFSMSAKDQRNDLLECLFRRRRQPRSKRGTTRDTRTKKT